MRRAVVAAGLAGLISVASLCLLRQRAPAEEMPERAQPIEVAVAPTAGVATEGRAIADQSEAARGPTPIDLRETSQTFRNSTLLFAIRRAGFYCADVVSAHESAEHVWVAGCSDMVGYLVTLRGAAQVDVHPLAYFDSVAPVFDRRPPEPGSLEPQPPRR